MPAPPENRKVTPPVRALGPGLLTRLSGKLDASVREVLAAGQNWATSVGLLPASYEALYESQARELPAEESIGNGPFDLIGRIELGILRMENHGRPTPLWTSAAARADSRCT
jgi:hypothetical protein